MGRVYRGFAIREQTKTTFFGRKKKQRFLVQYLLEQTVLQKLSKKFVKK